MRRRRRGLGSKCLWSTSSVARSERAGVRVDSGTDEVVCNTAGARMEGGGFGEEISMFRESAEVVGMNGSSEAVGVCELGGISSARSTLRQSRRT